MISVTSPKTDVPPSATRRSDAMPRAGFGISPDVVSELPHFIPITSAPAGQGVRAAFDASSTLRCASSAPFAIVCAAPPHSWIVRSSTRFPVARIPSTTAARSVLSQPRLSSSTEWRLGLQPNPVSVALTRSRSTDVWQHP
ncbi:hypothetical protein SDC9_184915 [bioreactor metagenome]|uniref:Uncharacterized protein n=1 Tax=bioreactor metagenome TaxID=1076179 RepID=A0A645HED6_9ZZZZ